MIKSRELFHINNLLHCSQQLQHDDREFSKVCLSWDLKTYYLPISEFLGTNSHHDNDHHLTTWHLFKEDKYRYKKDPRKNAILSNKSSIETQSTSVIQKIASISILSLAVDGEEKNWDLPNS